MATELEFRVHEVDTAAALGSGSVEVLGTPRLLAWMERATVEAAQPLLPAGMTSVGVEVHLRHRRSSAVGQLVVIQVLSAQVEDHRLVFEVVAFNRSSDDEQAAWARVVRAAVPHDWAG